MDDRAGAADQRTERLRRPFQPRGKAELHALSEGAVAHDQGRPGQSPYPARSRLARSWLVGWQNRADQLAAWERRAGGRPRGNADWTYPGHYATRNRVVHRSESADEDTGAPRMLCGRVWAEHRWSWSSWPVDVPVTCGTCRRLMGERQVTSSRQRVDT